MFPSNSDGAAGLPTQRFGIIFIPFSHLNLNLFPPYHKKIAVSVSGSTTAAAKFPASTMLAS